MVISRLLRRRPRQGELTGIYLTGRAGAPMKQVDQVEVLTDKGLAGDRYAAGAGYYQLTDACQVTMIDGEALARIERRTGIDLLRGEHRRNLVVAGLDLRRLERGTRLRVGPVVFEVSGPRPPCGYLERLSGPGIARALRRDAGICLRAVSGGIIRCGDPVIPD